MTMIAVNNRARKLAISLLLVGSAALMANRREVSDRPSSRSAFRAWFCYRSRPSACSDLAEVYLIESGRPCLSSRSTACSALELTRACARECHNAESLSPVYQTSPKEWAVPLGDNARDQIAWRANTKKYCDIGRLDLETVPLFPPLSGEALE